MLNNKNTMKCTILGMAMASALAAVGVAHAAGDRFVTIGTGGVTGVYYPTGAAICRLVNKGREEHKIRCSVESTAGSVYNVNAIRSGEMDFGVIQSDVQGDAVNGTGIYADAPYKELRALFSTSAEPVHLMTLRDASINDFKQLAGKRVNIGNPGSGQRAMADLAMETLGWSKKEFSLAGELKSTEQAGALCDGKMQAVFWAAGVPNGAAQEATSTCDVKIIPVVGDWVDAIVDKNPAYTKSVIPGGTYTGNPDDIPTYGTRGTFVTSANTPDDVAYHLVKAVFDDLDAFKKLHPAFTALKAEQMVKESLSAPLHPGAIKYYKEKGLL